MEEMIEAIAQFIGQVGFPSVAVYVLMRLEPTINRLNDTVKVLTHHYRQTKRNRL